MSRAAPGPFQGSWPQGKPGRHLHLSESEPRCGESAKARGRLGRAFPLQPVLPAPTTCRSVGAADRPSCRPLPPSEHGWGGAGGPGSIFSFCFPGCQLLPAPVPRGKGSPLVGLAELDWSSREATTLGWGRERRAMEPSTPRRRGIHPGLNGHHGRFSALGRSKSRL